MTRGGTLNAARPIDAAPSRARKHERPGSFGKFEFQGPGPVGGPSAGRSEAWLPIGSLAA